MLGVAGNLVLRGYLKHFNFFLSNIELLFDRSLDLAQVILPIGISFFTFQQIAYLVDVHRQGDLHYGLGDYSLFVSFFTQLITGPIVHRKEILLLLRTSRFLSFKADNIATGIRFFVSGLFNRVVIADSLSVYAGTIFNAVEATNPAGRPGSWLVLG